jgi:hypothetical protein
MDSNPDRNPEPDMKNLPTLLVLIATITPGLTRATDTPPGERMILVLDASGSMWGRIEGRAKIEIAREALNELLGELPADTAVGLQVYGHRSKGDCDDIELLAAPRAGAAEDLARRIASIQPKGMTPITAALQQAGASLAQHEGRASLVLISDGKETCNGDPCAAARRLRAQGVDTTIHVVGFDVGAEEREQLQCIAEGGGGRYFGAANAAELAAALARVREEVEVAPVRRVVEVKRPAMGSIEFRNLQRGNVFVEDAETRKAVTRYCNGCGSNTQVPAGTYRLRFDNFTLDDVEVRAGSPTIIDLDTVAGSLEFRNPPKGYVYIDDIATGKSVAHYCHGCGSNTQLRAGNYRLRFDTFQLEVKVEPGTTVEIE